MFEHEIQIDSFLLTTPWFIILRTSEICARASLSSIGFKLGSKARLESSARKLGSKARLYTILLVSTYIRAYIPQLLLPSIKPLRTKFSIQKDSQTQVRVSWRQYPWPEQSFWHKSVSKLTSFSPIMSSASFSLFLSSLATLMPDMMITFPSGVSFSTWNCSMA